MTPVPEITLNDGARIPQLRFGGHKVPADGRARSIGVSNFHVSHLQRLAAETDTVPAVNQVEAHPYFTNAAVRDFCKHNRIAFQAWSPLARGTLLDDPVIRRVAAAANRS